VLAQNASIAVIGGGVAGVTAAAAAATLGREVFLFEHRPVLCHLQHGCDTRWVHPHIYDWPDFGSDSPYAGLPVLDWKADTAAEVTKQIIAGLDVIRRSAGDRFHAHLGASTWLAEGRKVRWDNSRGDPRGSEREFDVIILATGFGVELGVREGETLSYWQNDSVNQPMPGGAYEKPLQYFISGPGDGGLIDLLRSRIEGFNQGRIIEDLITDEFLRHADLTARLRKIADDWKHLSAECREQRGWLFNLYMDLKNDGLLGSLRDRLKCRLRRDTACILNGTALTFSETLRLDKASLFNTLIAFLLYDLEAFSYVAGTSKCVGTDITISQNHSGDVDAEPFTVRYEVDRLIVRHGTDREQSLRLLGLSKDVVKELKLRQESKSEFKSTEEFWPAGWWRRNQVVPSKPQEPIEFVPPATIAIATTFVSTLSDVLMLRLKEKTQQSGDGELQAQDPEFRITLHRVIEIRGTQLFQQIAYYAGTRTEGSPGRAIGIEVGIVGLTCRIGFPIVIRSGPRWGELWTRLKVEPTRGINVVSHVVNSMLTCPMFAPAQAHDAGRKVSLVLFMDSQDQDFFTSDVLRIVFSASAGFVKNLDTLATEGTVRSASRFFLGHIVEDRKDDQDLIKEFAEIESKDDVFHEFAASLTFKMPQSFEIYM
jgi:hypothetical protein